MIKVTAFTFRDDNTFYGALSGQRIDKFTGHCMVYFPDGSEMIFYTEPNNGDRLWIAEGNKPKKEYMFA